MDLISSVGEAGPPGLLQHVRERDVGGVAEGTVHLDRPVDDPLETVGDEMLRHRHDGDEVHALFDLIRGVQHHQLALVQLDR